MNWPDYDYIEEEDITSKPLMIWVIDVSVKIGKKLETIDDAIAAAETWGWFESAEILRNWKRYGRDWLMGEEFDEECLRESYDNNVWDYQSNT